MKKILIPGIILVVGIAAVMLYQSASDSTNVMQDAEVVTFVAGEGQFTMQYDADGEIAKLSFSGVQYDVTRVETASGSRYQTEDGRIVFLEQDGKAEIEIDGDIVIENATSDRRRVEVLKSNKQGDPDANKYDFGADDDNESEASSEVCNVLDQDCTGGDTALSAEIACGSGTTSEEGDCVPEHRDDDSDGDSLPIENDASEAGEAADTAPATDYNSSRSNKNF